jgi:V/A-type H+-transporting ATPase subunit K
MPDPSSLSVIGVGLAISGSVFGAAFAIIMCGTAIAVIGVEKPQIVSRLIITVVLGEALAIYGLLIAFMILPLIPTIETYVAAYKAIIAGLITAASTIAAGLGIGYTGSSLAGAAAEKPETYSMNIISLVLSEALAIYGLLMSFMLIGQI